MCSAIPRFSCCTYPNPKDPDGKFREFRTEMQNQTISPDMGALTFNAYALILIIVDPAALFPHGPNNG